MSKIIKEIPDHEWQDMDVVSTEVQEVRRNAPRIASVPRVNQPLKRIDESQEEWQKRRDG